MLLVSLFEQPERLIFVAESHINLGDCIEIDISVRGQVPEFLGDLQRISPSARNRINPTKATSNGVVFYRYNLVMIGNFVVFGKGLRIHALHCIRPSQRGAEDGSVWIQVES